MVDALAVECHFAYLSTSRTGFASLHSFDKDVHSAALAKLPKDAKG